MPEPQTPPVYNLLEAHPTAIVIQCSDPRFQKAFRDFTANELHLRDGEYIPFVISGGVAALAEPLKLPKEFKFIKERIELFTGLFKSINRVVLINHEDCRHYDMLKSTLGSIFLQHAAHMTDRQIKDLRGVAKMVMDFVAPGFKLEAYYARIVRNGTATVPAESATAHVGATKGSDGAATVVFEKV